jgi:hypothetical protein
LTILKNQIFRESSKRKSSNELDNDCDTIKTRILFRSSNKRKSSVAQDNPEKFVKNFENESWQLGIYNPLTSLMPPTPEKVEAWY